MYGDFEAVIGLEIHAQLFTKSKLFSSAGTTFGEADNENVTPLCAGMPGTLPVLNREAVAMAIKTGLALNCEIQEMSIFARKQYFYPDLPKGYQISQYDKPICAQGFVEFYLEGEKQKVLLDRAHMEEDAGKSIHQGEFTLVNLNRAGIPLLEIVTQPVMSTPQEAAAFARTVRKILRYTEVCDGNLEEGNMRCDCNVSVRRIGETELGTKVELKNINSFRFIEKAIEYEIHRQIDCIQSNEEIYQETRLYDAAKNMTFSMRSKEEANDYRYFPDPDILPLWVEKSWVLSLEKTLPEMPTIRFERFIAEYGLSPADAEILTQERPVADFFESVTQMSKNAKLSANWVVGELQKQMNDHKIGISEIPITASQLAELIRLIDDKTISGKMAKQVFEEMWKTQKTASVLIKEMGLQQITDDSVIRTMVKKVLKDNPENVAQFKAGKDKLFGFFVGQVMKMTKGQANPELVNQLIQQELKK